MESPMEPQMDAEQIETREFFVGLRGYDRDEVDAFLAEVAERHRALEAELEAVRLEAATPPADPLVDLGANIADILRSAQSSAESIKAEAQADAERIRAEADADADQRRQQAEARRASADEKVAEAQRQADEMLATAEGLVGEAKARVQDIELEAERRGRELAAARLAAEVDRFADALRRSDALRARLAETADELQLALLALGDPVADAKATLETAVTADRPSVTQW